MNKGSKTLHRKAGRGIRILCLFVVCTIMLGICSMPKSHAEKETIRVGYIDYDGFIEEKKGNYTGYGVEYLERIAEYTGWRYEYIYDTWENCLNKLENGEIDMLCTAQYTVERGEKYQYTQIPLGYESTVVYVKEDSDIFYRDLEAMEGTRVGLLNESFQTQEFFQFAQENDLEFVPVYYATETQIMDALENDSIDMAAVGSLAYHTGVRVVEQYGAEAFYCIAGKGNTQLTERVDDALRKIKIDMPGLENELNQKYYSISMLSSSPLYTREEHEYIANAEPVKVKLMADSIPLSYQRNGEQAGIFVGYLQLLSQRSGLKIEIEMSITKENIDAQMQNLKNEDYLLLRTKRNIESEELDSSLTYTNSLLNTQLSYVKHRKHNYIEGRRDYKFALTTEMRYLEPMLKRDSENFEIQYYNSSEECLEAVLNQKADIAIQDSYVVTYMMQKPIYKAELTEYPGVPLQNGVCLVGSQENQLLFDILNKTINYISSEEENDLVTKEILTNTYHQTLSDTLYEYRYLLLGIGISIVVAGAVSVLLLWRMLKLKIEKKEYELLQNRVQRDELTGVFNRPTFYEKAKEMIDNAKVGMCIVIMDISNFKIVNDLYGIESGDRLLKQMAEKISRLCSGREFIVGRFTGDHFYICLSSSDFQEIHFPKRYKTFLEDMDITVSYGVFEVENQKDVPVNIMCDRASIAVHDKERKQLSYIRYYSEEERQRIIQEQEIVNDMEKALMDHQFCIHIQPKYDIYEEKIVGAEALVRWIHPQKGMIPPDSFIGVFEKNGFILRLDYYVWEETCKLIRSLKKKGLGKDIPVSINVSRAHFYGKELKDKLEELTAKYHLKPEDLELEITETICAEDPDIIQNKIIELQEAGFKVAMDDFGSGYSSLNMLKEMPFDILKMDLKFLEGGDNIERSHNILKTLIALAHSLKLLVVVEGVETKEQVDFLKTIGNHYVQGYYFSRPVESKDYEAMLRQEKG